MKTRKFLFKAQTKNNKEWIYGLPLNKDDKLYIINLDDTSKLTEVLPETLSEFTNRFMDDESTEIYENDIIYHREQYWIIKYCEALAGFQAVYHDEDMDFDYFLPITQVIEGELRGNVFDNPEFVNKKIE